MATKKKLIHFKKGENYDIQKANGNILDSSICFIQDRRTIITHGTEYKTVNWGRIKMDLKSTFPEEGIYDNGELGRYVYNLFHEEGVFDGFSNIDWNCEDLYINGHRIDYISQHCDSSHIDETGKLISFFNPINLIEWGIYGHPVFDNNWLCIDLYSDGILKVWYDN